LQKPARHEEKRDDFAGILDPSGSAQSYRLRRFEPSEALAPFVEHYWIVAWALPEGVSYPAEVLPHPRLNLAFTAERGWVTGVTTAKYTYEVKGSGRVLGVMFRPGGFRPFFGRAVAELMDREVEAETVFSRATDAARRAVLVEAEAEGMVAAAEALLIGGGLPEVDPNIAGATRVVELVRSDREIVTVGGLAERAGLNERTLQHLFRHYVGATPKWVIRLYRLVEAAARASGDEAPNWTAIAHELGYADQAHFTNDFRRIVGRAPGEYAREIRGA
jgi:AraC-like DNA-binding protein